MAAKGLFINSTEQGFTVRGVKNNFFPDNATLAYPANSVILITDDSDMATFRSASNYDALFSSLIKDININGERATKDNIIETFNEAANKPMSNPDAFTSVEYDGTKSLIFYNDKGDEVASVDVTPFIKDGMIEDVEISDGNLVIHFNTDSEIKDIYIPLTEIFDPEAYYTKQEIDNQVNDIWDTIDEKEEVISTSLNALNEDVENLSNDKQDALEFYSEEDDGAHINIEGDDGELYANVSRYNNSGDKAIELFASKINEKEGRVSDYGLYIDTQENAIILQAGDGVNSNSLTVSPDGVNINGEGVIVENIFNETIDNVYADLEGYLIDLDVIMTRGLTDAEWDGTIEAVRNNRPVYIKVDGYWCTLQSYHLNGNEMTLLAASDNFVSIYTVTKLGSNQYSLSNVDKQYVSQSEKDAWNAKADASNVYTKTESDAKYATQVVVNTALEGKADKSDTYTKSQIDGFLDNATQLLETKANSADVYTKTAVDEKLADYVDIDTYNGKELATAKALTQLNDTKADKTELPDVSTLATKTELNAKANSADLATVATSGSYDDLTNKPVIPEGVTVDAALSDTSENPVQNKVVKGAIDEAKAYYVDFGVLTTQGIHDADWDGLVAAIGAHRPIYAGLESRYYTAECLSQEKANKIIMTASDEQTHYFYTFTKNGSENYGFDYEEMPYTTSAEKTAWNAKQDAISDLATIRSGAAAGATAYQKPSTGIPASDIADGVIPTVPTNVSDFTNDAGYLTQHQSLDNYYTKSEIDAMIGNINTILASI